MGSWWKPSRAGVWLLVKLGLLSGYDWRSGLRQTDGYVFFPQGNLCLIVSQKDRVACCKAFAVLLSVSSGLLPSSLLPQIRLVLLRGNFTVFPSSRGSEPGAKWRLCSCSFTLWGQLPSRRCKRHAFLVPLNWMAEFKFSVKANSSFLKCLQTRIDRSPKGLLQFCFI